jgi:hypothetical protein
VFDEEYKLLLLLFDLLIFLIVNGVNIVFHSLWNQFINNSSDSFDNLKVTFYCTCLVAVTNPSVKAQTNLQQSTWIVERIIILRLHIIPNKTFNRWYNEKRTKNIIFCRLCLTIRSSLSVRIMKQHCHRLKSFLMLHVRDVNTFYSHENIFSML